MIDPIFWLGLSILLVALSITAMLIVAIPAFQELGRASRSAEKLFDTLNRELPPTLEAIRRSGLEISDLTDDVSQGVQSAGQIVKQVDDSISGVKQQVQKAQTTSRSFFAGMRAAWKTFAQSPRSTALSSKGARRGLPTASRNAVALSESRRYTHIEEYREEVDLVYDAYEGFEEDELDNRNGTSPQAPEMREPPASPENRQPIRRDRDY